MYYQKGESIAGYVVLFAHKHSTSAESYRVKDKAGKIRFLKLIDRSKLAPRQIDAEGCVMEVKIVKDLEHHNLCRCLDSGELILCGRPFSWFVSDFVSGETLADRIMRGVDLSVYEIKSILKAVLSALSYLHCLPTPILHNGVSTDHVLINLMAELEDLKLINFGRACYLGQSPGRPRAEDRDLFYLAPERFSGIASMQSDLYSVGVLAYHLLYHQLPWYFDISRIGTYDLTDRVLQERSKPLVFPNINKYELDDQLRSIIAKALHSDVEERFQTAEEFAAALDGKIEVHLMESQSATYAPGREPSHGIAVNSSGKKTGFAAIAGMEDLKNQLQEEVIEPLHNPEKYDRYGITIPNGMLLYGPPGCGKTFFAKHFAEEVGFNYRSITPADLKSRFVNATQENIAALFQEAKENAPVIIFIDEINELVPNRDNTDIHEMSRSAVNEMLAQMDRTGEKGIFVIGATNYPNMIDPAMLRSGRFDKKYYVGIPDKAARAAIFRLYLEDRPYDFGLDYERLSGLTEGYVSADIHLIVNDASREALHQDCKITMTILEETIARTKPSVSKDELRKYDRIRAEMNGEKPESEKRRRVGFK